MPRIVITKEHWISAKIYGRMLYQLSYSQLGDGLLNKRVASNKWSASWFFLETGIREFCTSLLSFLKVQFGQLYLRWLL